MQTKVLTFAIALPALALPVGIALATSTAPLPPQKPAAAIEQQAVDADSAAAGLDADTEAAEDVPADAIAAGEETPEDTSPEAVSSEDASGDEGAEGKLAGVEMIDGYPIPRPRPAEAGPSANELHETAGFDTPVVDAHTAAVTSQAINDIAAKRYASALAIQKTVTDPAAKKLIEFYYVRDYSVAAPHERIAAFLRDNSDWPNQELIRKRYEVALLSQRASDDVILEAFRDSPPITSPGVIAYASALRSSGSEDRAGELIRALWRSHSLTTGEERLVLDRFADAISLEDHKKRMDMLLYDGDSSAAQRVAAKLDANQRKLAEARIAVNRRTSSAGSALDNLPQEVRDDPGYVLSRAQWNRRNGRDETAAEILLKAEFEDDELVDPDEWSLERRIVARELVEAGKTEFYETAYQLVSQHSAKSAIDRLESEWHAGWIALQFLNDPERASKHFAEILNIAKTPISTSRGHYWLGRSAESAGDIAAALKHYKDAGELSTTYYGQLALNRIGETNVGAPRKPLFADTARRLVGERDSIRAMRLLAQIGREDEAARHMISMTNETDDPVTLVGICETAHQMGLTWGTVWMGKAGTRAGAPTEAYAFASNGMPEFPTVGPEIDPAVVYAIARQESVFNPVAVSPAGARGLMQMMPATAKATARAYGQSYDLNRLTSDARYNATLGAAHLGELAENFDNAYALVFAAYNAGPGRVYEWIERFGDPRKGEIDPVDWVELIPYNETRNYVQRVIEGLQVYRAELSGDDRLLIAEDLHMPSDIGQSEFAAATAAAPTGGTAGDNGVPGVFTGFSKGPVSAGSVPSTALGFGGSL